MKDVGLIPVIIKNIDINGAGNISLQLIPQHGGYYLIIYPVRTLIFTFRELVHGNILFVGTSVVVNIMKSASNWQKTPAADRSLFIIIFALAIV